MIQTAALGCVRVLMIWAIGVGIAAASGALLKPLEVNAIPAAAPDRTIHYGSDTNQFGQLFLPQGEGPFPVAVVIHGRRVDSDGGGWPNTFLDVAAAIDHLRRMAPEFRLDLNRAALASQSGDYTSMTVIEGAGHFEIIAPGTAAWPTVESAVLKMFREINRPRY